jgi:hypothetical protein
VKPQEPAHRRIANPSLTTQSGLFSLSGERMRRSSALATREHLPRWTERAAVAAAFSINCAQKSGRGLRKWRRVTFSDAFSPIRKGVEIKGDGVITREGDLQTMDVSCS